MILDKPLLLHADVVAQPLPEITWDVAPLVARGDRVVFYGEFGTFKSWVMLHLALHLGAGAPWLGFNIPQPRRVLYVDEEMNELELRRRVKRLNTGSPMGGTPQIAYLSRRGVRFDGYGASTLLAYLREQKFSPHFVVVDALRRVLVGDENKAADIAAFWHHLEPISRQGITVCITHHMNKPPVEGKRAARYRASGSTDILAGSDASFAIETVANRPGVQIAKVTGIKARSAMERASFLIQLEDVGEGTTLTPAVEEAPRPLTPEERGEVFRRRV